MLTFDQITELIELVARHRLSGLELERSGFRLRVDGETRAVAPVAVPAAVQAQPVAEPVIPAVQAAPPPTAPTAPAAAAEGDPGEGLPEGAHILTSPIVGTFYRRPNPDAGAFCQVGDEVKEGQVLCIVEAMKLMNEIEADVDGVILEIYPKNAQPVEYGEPLFAIKTS